jgi:hypothetical protein
MIDRAKLAALPTATLIELQRTIKEVIEAKSRRELRVGTEATFFNRRIGRDTRILVTGFGPKNVMGYEVDDHGNHLTMRKWRVHPSVLTPVEPAKPKPIVLPRFGGGNDRPAGPLAGAF